MITAPKDHCPGCEDLRRPRRSAEARLHARGSTVILSAVDLSGKAAVITGGGGGIGSATGVAMGRAGARVLLVDVDAQRLEVAAEAVGATGAEVHTQRRGRHELGRGAWLRRRCRRRVRNGRRVVQQCRDHRADRCAGRVRRGRVRPHLGDQRPRRLPRSALCAACHARPALGVDHQHGVAFERARPSRARRPTTPPSTRCSA